MADDLYPLIPNGRHRSALRRAMREEARYPAFDEEAADNVVRALATGIPVTVLGDLAGYPAYWVINYWRSTVPAFDEDCVRASEAYAEQLAAEVVAIADQSASERPTADRALSIQARQWAVKILNRKKYDPAVKVAVTHGLVDADSASDAELARVALGQRPGRVIEHESGSSDAD